MSTLLAEYKRKAAHGKHRCGWCLERIAAGEIYCDQRIADDGHVFTWREHITCGELAWAYLHSDGIYDGDEVAGSAHDVWREAMAAREAQP